MSKETSEWDWDKWFEALGDSQIPKVVTTLDNLNETEDCLLRLLESDVVEWSFDSRLAIQTVVNKLRNTKEQILAIEMRKE